MYIKREHFVENRSLQARDLIPGTVFCRGSIDASIYIKLKPVSFLLNSSTVKYSISHNKALVADIETGACFFIPGDESVKILEATVSIVSMK